MSTKHEEDIAASITSRQLKTSSNLLDPRPPSSLINEYVQQEDRESRGIADAVCITPSTDEPASLMIKEKLAEEPPLGLQASKNTTSEVRLNNLSQVVL